MPLLGKHRKIKSGWFKKVVHSIFFKLILILFFAGIFIDLMVILMFRNSTEHHKQALQESITNYANYLIQDIGNPPDLNRASEIASQFSLNIRFESPSLNWSTTESLPYTRQIHMHQWREYPHIRFGWYHGAYLMSVKEKAGTFLFAVDLGPEHEESRERWVIGVLFFLPLVLLGAYFAMRKVLKPIKWLNEGVQQVGMGNLDYQVPVKRPDELGKLSQAFNGMTDRIAQMLHSKEQLLLDVSHEFRSPLTRMKVALEFMPENSVKKNIKEDVEELENMVSEILESARMESEYGHLNRRPVNLVSLLHEAVLSFNEQSALIRIHSMPEEIVLHLDAERIKIVFRNIITNAIKHSGDLDDERQRMVEIFLEQKDAQVIVRIRNFGEKIPEKDLPFLFEPFYRVDKSRSKETGGYGLGLHLCRKIMEAHGGKIEAESMDSTGTTISLFFLNPPKS
ncbi:MAG: HAMP domain-containing histidine kinase [SAR324 cluster bacterium]|nr:HAMP domain-containing histidine kinase [SAR324 cluster bacterium]